MLEHKLLKGVVKRHSFLSVKENPLSVNNSYEDDLPHKQVKINMWNSAKHAGFLSYSIKVKKAKIGNRCIQVPHLTRNNIYS